MVHKAKWIKTDAWRGYYQAPYAVLGASDTGLWSDSPCPSDKVVAELTEFQKVLRDKGIQSEIKTTSSSNAFMGKRWVVVPSWEHKKALKIAKDYMKKNDDSTQYVHGVD